MFQTTNSELICVAAGAAAVAALLCSSGSHPFSVAAPSECSARVSTSEGEDEAGEGAISARAATTESAGDDADGLDKLFELQDPEGHDTQFQGMRVARDKAGAARRSLGQASLDPTFKNNIGTGVLAAGRCADTVAKPPPVSANMKECMFMMPEAMAYAAEAGEAA